MYRDLLIERWNPTKIEEYGDAAWKNCKGELHRGGDQPAIVCYDGSMLWYKNGKEHRGGDKPSSVFSDGSMEWCKNGIIHRGGNRPAVAYLNVDMGWYKNGEPHYPPQEIQYYWEKYYKEYFEDLRREVQYV